MPEFVLFSSRCDASGKEPVGVGEFSSHKSPEGMS